MLTRHIMRMHCCEWRKRMGGTLNQCNKVCGAQMNLLGWHAPGPRTLLLAFNNHKVRTHQMDLHIMAATAAISRLRVSLSHDSMAWHGNAELLRITKKCTPAGGL
eukprot:8469274-Pyramimonas_sp.AAC.1